MNRRFAIATAVLALTVSGAALAGPTTSNPSYRKIGHAAKADRTYAVTGQVERGDVRVVPEYRWAGGAHAPRFVHVRRVID